jgi:hypothetical protein
MLICGSVSSGSARLMLAIVMGSVPIIPRTFVMLLLERDARCFLCGLTVSTIETFLNELSYLRYILL